MPDSRSPNVISPKSSGLAPNGGDVIAWIREHWIALGVVVLLLLIWWLRSGEPRTDNGRYVLVKDDVPCQTANEGETRRWCYLVLDTRTGRLEERARRMASHDRR